MKRDVEPNQGERSPGRDAGDHVAANGPDGGAAFEVRNVHRGLDIELLVSGEVAERSVDEVLRRVSTLVGRQPGQLCIDLEGATIDADAVAPLADGLVQARAELAENGGSIVVREGEDLRRSLPADLLVS